MQREFDENSDMLCRKGIFPEEWLDCIAKLDYVGLPDQDEFYSSLKQEHATDSNYQFALEVYARMNLHI